MLLILDELILRSSFAVLSQCLARLLHLQPHENTSIENVTSLSREICHRAVGSAFLEFVTANTPTNISRRRRSNTALMIQDESMTRWNAFQKRYGTEFCVVEGGRDSA